MQRSLLAAGALAGLLAAPAVPAQELDLRPLLDVMSSETNTDGPPTSLQRFTIYHGGTLMFQSRSSDGRCVLTKLAAGVGSQVDLRRLNRALRAGQVSSLKDCGLGFQFGTNLEYRLEWQSAEGRANRFKFGTYYRTSCPAGVPQIKNAVDAFVAAVLRDPKTEVLQRNRCEP
jgi:hypothetical protein